ncbi:MAG: hypothetical protein ABEJ24_02790 [Candidatus Magasanikbacteria bacterium]
MENKSKGEKFYHKKTKSEKTEQAIEATKELNKFEGDIENDPERQISEWLSNLEQIWLDYENEEKIDRMKEVLHDKYVIDMEEITEESSHFENVIKMSIEEGREDDLRKAGIEFEKEYDDEGNLHVSIEYIPEDKKQELAETVIDDQKESLDQWVDYFTSEDSDSFPMWAKYWAFTGMTKLGTYDKETNTFDKRSKGTVAPFPDLNREALALAVDYMINKYSEEYLDLEEEIREQENKLDRLDSYRRLKSKIEEKKDELPEQAIEGMKRNLESYQKEFGKDIDFDEKEQELQQELQQLKNKEEEVLSTERLSEEEQEIFSTESFAKMYAKALEKTVPTEEKELQRTEGSWVKFPQGSDPEEYVPEDFDKSLLESIQGKGTGWCTAGKNTARRQLEGGDFYVYYSENEEGEEEIPRVAIRMERDEIAEVRGIDEDQNLDPYIAEELSEKLDEVEGIDEKEIEKYKKKAEDMEKLSEVAQKHHSGEELTKEELRFLYEIDEDIDSFGYQHGDPRIEEIREERNANEDIATIFDKPEIEGDLVLKRFNITALPEQLKRVGGDLNLDFTNIEKLPEGLEVGGDLRLCGTNIEKLPEGLEVGGDLVLIKSNIKDLGPLKVVNGDLNLRKSDIKTLGQLRGVGGDLKLDRTDLEDLGQLEKVDGDLVLKGSYIKDLGPLKVVNGDLDLRNSDVKNLGQLKSVGGDLKLDRTDLEDLGQLEKVGGDLDINNIPIRLQRRRSRVPVSLDELTETNIKNLGQLKRVDGNFHIEAEEIEDLGQLESVGGDLVVRGSIKNLGQLKHVGGGLFIGSQNFEDFGHLKSVGGDLDIKFTDKYEVPDGIKVEGDKIVHFP